MNLFDRMVDADHSLSLAAMRLVRAGLDPNANVSDEQMRALETASDELFMERVAYLVTCLHNPAKAVAPYDGGGALWAQKKAAILASSGGR